MGEKAAAQRGEAEQGSGRGRGSGARPAPLLPPHRRCSCPFGGRFSRSSFLGSTRPPASSSRTKPSCKWPEGREGRQGVRGARPSPSPPSSKTAPRLAEDCCSSWVRWRGGHGGDLGGRGGGAQEGVSGKASQKRGLLERALTKFPWSAKWERQCWQSNLHVPRTGSRKL